MHKFLWRILSFALLVAILLLFGAACGPDIPADANPVIAAFAKQNNIDYDAYPKSLITLLENNPEAEAFVLQYPILSKQPQEIDLSEYENRDSVPLFLQWDTRWGYQLYGDDMTAITGCGPVCLSMAAYYLTGDDQYFPDRVITFAEENGYYSPGNGSSWTLISEGGKQLGFDVKELPLDKGTILHALSKGKPVICVVGPGDFTTTGHFLVITGTENGQFKINDPNSIINSEKLWDYEQIKGQIKNLWSIGKN